MLYVKHPNEKDRERIKEIWKISFGDEDSYIENFLKNGVSPQNILALCDVKGKEETIASVLFLLDGQIKIKNKKFKSSYLYAACTHPDYRGRGCMGTLLKGAEKYLKDRGYDFICLVPAENSLFNYYSKFGYEESFCERTFTLTYDEAILFSGESFKTKKPSGHDLFLVYSDMLKTKDSFLWDENFFDYVLSENEAGGNDSTAIYNGNSCLGYALFYKENDEIYVRECAFKEGYFFSLLKSICTLSDFKKIHFRTYADFEINHRSKKRFNAMTLPLNIEAQNNIKNINNAYLGHTLG